MSQESEQAQEAWYNHMITSGSGIEGKEKVLSGYKAALKAEIEYDNKVLEDLIKIGAIDEFVGLSAIRQNNKFLSLLDTVTPITHE